MNQSEEPSDILVVCDDAKVRAALTGLLRMARRRVVDASLRTAEETLVSGRPKAILAFIDGPRASEWLSAQVERHPQTPVVALIDPRSPEAVGPSRLPPHVPHVEVPTESDEILGSLDGTMRSWGPNVPCPQAAHEARPMLELSSGSPSDASRPVARRESVTPKLNTLRDPEQDELGPKLKRDRPHAFPALLGAISGSFGLLRATGVSPTWWRGVASNATQRLASSGHSALGAHAATGLALAHVKSGLALFVGGTALASLSMVAMLVFLGFSTPVPGVGSGPVPFPAPGPLPTPPASTGHLSVWIHDAPCACAHVYVTFTNVAVRAANVSGVPSGSWTELSNASRTWDMLRLNSTSLSSLLSSGNLTVGTYTGLRLGIQNVTVVLLNGETLVADVVCPTAQLVGSFTIAPNGNSALTLDLDLASSLHVVGSRAYFTPEIGMLTGGP